MARIKCRACGRGYSYQGDCCPHCGAFNRRPQREYIGADGDVHYVDEKVCFEEKVCYEDQADKAWRDSPDRKPERRGRVKRPNTTRFTSSEANQVIDRFTRSANESAKKFAGQFLDSEDGAAVTETVDRFARNFREKTAQFSSKRRNSDYASRRERSSGKGAVVATGLSILIAIIGLVANIVEDIDFSPIREVPVYPEDVATAPAIPDNLHYYDYGGIFRLNDGREFTAFTNQMTVDGSGTVNVSVYCDGMGEGVWPVLVDEWTMTEYEPNMSTEWQENNYDLTFYTETHDPNEYWYTLYYRDTSTGERYHIAEINSTGYMSADPNASQNGVFRDIPLLDGETLYTTVLMEHEDGLLTAMVLCDYDDLHARFIPYLQDESNGDLYDPIDFLDNGVGEYWYTFDIGTANFDREFTFVYYDADYDTMLNVASYEVAVDGTADPTHQWGEEYEFYLRDGGVLHANVLMHYDQRKHEVVAYATHDGDPERFHPHLSLDGAENISLYPPSDIESDDGLEYRYAFDTLSLETGPSGDQYTFCYLDNNTGDIFYTETLFVPPVPGVEPEEVNFTLSDGTEVTSTTTYSYVDGTLRVQVAHNGDGTWLRAFAYDSITNDYYDVDRIEDDGAGNYTFFFDMASKGYPAQVSFGLADVQRGRNYFLVDCYA